jgi:uncharacterized protein with von Willebrand factor type A (vWA) domain
MERLTTKGNQMGLCYKTTKWSDGLWQGHCQSSVKAKETVRDGKKRQKAFKGFAQDLHAKLYLRNEPDATKDAPEWATDLHSQAEDLAEFRQLRARCQSDGFAAGVATEALLSALVDLVPESDDQDQNDQGNGQGQAGQGQSDGPGNGEQRRKLRQAVRDATTEVDQAEAAIDGLADAMGVSMPGTAIGENVTLENLNHLRETYKLVKKSPQLQSIADLAGRLQRIAASKKRSKVDRAIGAVKGIELSGDLARVIPSELAGLNSANNLVKLSTLSKIIEKRALSYRMQGEQPEKRGPIVLLADESASMGNGREVWAKALAMAVLSTATKQKRAWHLVGFNYQITHETAIEPGQATIADVNNALCRQPSGGTNFDAPLIRACEILQSSATMNKADVIFITDGEDDLSETTIKRVNALKQSDGVNVYVLGVGRQAQLQNLAPIASETYQVNSLSTDENEMIAPVINLD